MALNSTNMLGLQSAELDEQVKVFIQQNDITKFGIKKADSEVIVVGLAKVTPFVSLSHTKKLRAAYIGALTGIFKPYAGERKIHIHCTIRPASDAAFAKTRELNNIVKQIRRKVAEGKKLSIKDEKIYMVHVLGHTLEEANRIITITSNKSPDRFID